MIYIERTINISDNNANIEEPVVLYKGDGNIEVQFTIKNNPFKYKAGIDLTYGQLVIKRPKTDPIFSDVAKLSSSKVLFIITGEMIDEFEELGDYDFQIRLLNADMSSRATLPPVSAGITIKEPLCEETVNTAPVNYSRAAINRETVDTFDEEGNYNKTKWSNGDIITDKKLNKIEDALYEINDNSAAKEDIPVAVSQLENDADYATKEDIPTDVSAFTNDAGYVSDISHLAAKDELPTNVSELTNDAGYLTEHQSLEDYALKTDVPSTDGLATEQYVNDAVANVDLTDYATKEELPIVPTDISAFTNDIGYINDISHLASKDELPSNVSELNNDVGYLTEHQSLDGYVTEDTLNAALEDVDVDLTGYATESYVNNVIGDINAILDAINGEVIEPEPEPEPEPEIPLYQSGEFSGNMDIEEVSVMVTSEHTDLMDMFSMCRNLRIINGIDQWDTSNVTNMSSMFLNCRSFESLDLSSFDTSNVENMRNMFSRCENLKELNLSSFEIREDCDTDSMLSYCRRLHTLRLDNCSNDTINKIITSSGFPTGTIEGVQRQIFVNPENVGNLTAPDGWEFVEQEEPYIVATFGTNESVRMLGEPSNFWKASFDNGTTWEDNDDNMTEGNEIVYLKPEDTDEIKIYRLFENSSYVTHIEFYNFSAYPVFVCADYMFSNCSNLTELDLSSLNFSNGMYTLEGMFSNCNNLESLNLSSWSLYDDTNTYNMLGGCNSLHTLRLDNCDNSTVEKIITSEGFPTGTISGVARTIYCKQSNVTGLTVPDGWIFVDCDTGEEIVPEPEIPVCEYCGEPGCDGSCQDNGEEPEIPVCEYCGEPGCDGSCQDNGEEQEIPLYQLDMFRENRDIEEVSVMVTSEHTDLNGMFHNCENLRTINGINDWDTSNVTTMDWMFSNCYNLTTLDLNSFDTSNVENMREMFSWCENLKELNLSSFEIREDCGTDCMFERCNKLHTLRLDNCNEDTIRKIVESREFPTGEARDYEGTRQIYVKEENVGDLTAPDGWEFAITE